MSELPIGLRARLSAQRALLGAVTGNMRAIVLDVMEREIAVRFYVDGSPSEIDLESASCVETEMMADFFDQFSVRAECVRVDSPSPIEDSGIWVYRRMEAD